MSKSSSTSSSDTQSADALATDAPELKLDHAKIDALIEPEARVKAYQELFTKYLEAIEKEPSVNKQRYYGQHLENLMQEIENDPLVSHDSYENGTILLGKKSTEKLLSKIATFTENLKNPEQGRYITIHASSAIKDLNNLDNFKEAVGKCVTTQVSDHIKDKLKPWANERGDTSLSRELTAQEEKLWVQGGGGKEKKQYETMGKKFWDKCLSFMEKFFPPKAIAFDVTKEAKKYEVLFKAEKTSYITKALNFIKGNVDKNQSGKILESQINKNIESLTPKERSSDMVKSFQQQPTVTTTTLPFNKLPSTQLGK